MKTSFLFILGLIIVGGSIFLYFHKPVLPIQEVNQNRTIKIGSSTIKVEIADTPAARALGLSGREGLPEDSGMLFIFEESGKYGFWMKKMKFALDIVWINEDFKVVGVAENITPQTFPEVFYPSEPVKYVLELNGGKFQKSGIDIGSEMYFE